jgi:hypothetical protein
MTPVKGPDLARYDRISLRFRSERPMRLWIQIRGRGEPDRRWARSVYVGPEGRDVSIPFDEFLPVDSASAALDLQSVDSLLFVVDTIHTALGTSGQVRFDEIRLERTR